MSLIGKYIRANTKYSKKMRIGKVLDRYRGSKSNTGNVFMIDYYLCEEYLTGDIIHIPCQRVVDYAEHAWDIKEDK